MTEKEDKTMSEAAQTAQLKEVENLPEAVVAVYAQWDQIVADPTEWLQNLEGQIAFVAGGGLPLQFGKSGSEIWQAYERSLADSGSVEVGGVKLVGSELRILGDFYRFLFQNEHFLHCIDERLQGDLEHLQTQVHHECGACAATQEAVGEYLPDDLVVEDQLVIELEEDPEDKQPIYSDMSHRHTSLTILVDLHGDDSVADEEKREQLKEAGGLAFQVSLPVNYIRDFTEEVALDPTQQQELLEALVKWNVQLARNIIGGNHNSLQKNAEYAQIIVDRREVEENAISIELSRLVEQVEHGRLVVIS